MRGREEGGEVEEGGEGEEDLGKEEGSMAGMVRSVCRVRMSEEGQGTK
jgi:hypothetical protein